MNGGDDDLPTGLGQWLEDIVLSRAFALASLVN